MKATGVYVQVLGRLPDYSDQQLLRACHVANAINRGRLILCEHPERAER